MREIMLADNGVDNDHKLEVLRMRLLPFVIVCSILSVCPIVSLVNHQDSGEKAKQELLDLENHWLQKEHDPNALESILAPDFLHVLGVGIITKEQHIDYWRKHPAPPSGPKHFEDMHVRVYGNVGIVNGAVVANEASGTRRTLFTDVFAYRDGKWQAVSAQELPVPTKTP
jgi:Domain of unknown function (DUF4440)